MGYRKRGDTFRVSIDILQPRSGGIVIIRNQAHRQDLLSRGHEESQMVREWAEFKRWDYDIKLKIDMQSTVFDKQSGTHYINPILRRHTKLKYLLNAWSLTDTDDKGSTSPIVVRINPESNQLDHDFIEENINGSHAIDPIILDAFVERADMVLELGMSEEEVESGLPKI